MNMCDKYGFWEILKYCSICESENASGGKNRMTNIPDTMLNVLVYTSEDVLFCQ